MVSQVSQMTKTGVSASVRFLFAKIGVNERNGDITPTIVFRFKSVTYLPAEAG